MKYKTEIRKIFKAHYKDNALKYSEEEFRRFLEFLEIDFYDWVRSNLKIWLREHYSSEE